MISCSSPIGAIHVGSPEKGTLVTERFIIHELAARTAEALATSASSAVVILRDAIDNALPRST